MTPSVSSQGSPVTSEEDKGLTTGNTDRCTAGCTNPAGTDNAGNVEALAATLLGLSPADRARLAAMLLGQQAGQPPTK